MAYGKLKVDTLESSGGGELTLPTSSGSSGQVLTTDGNGVLSFASNAGLLDEDDFASNSATNPASQQSIKAYVATEVADLVDSSPAALDTLSELAAALGDDENFSTTVTNSIALKAPIDDPSFTGDATCAGSITDGKGDVRSIPQNTQASTYTLVAADAGKHILASGTVTVPDGIFSAGDAVTIINDTASDLTITKTITTMYNTADDGDSDDRTLATRGMATILFASGTISYISGAGLS